MQAPSQPHAPVENTRGHLPPIEPGIPAMIMRRRELYWQNIMQEMLTGLAAAAASNPKAELFDGRVAILTQRGQRIPIASIAPLFACSVPSAGGLARSLATDVQCTVYQVRTPNGEVYTLPLHEVVAFHALSPELVEKLQQAAEQTGAGKASSGRPFGFAAFTSLANAESRETGEADTANGTPHSPETAG